MSVFGVPNNEEWSSLPLSPAFERRLKSIMHTMAFMDMHPAALNIGEEYDSVDYEIYTCEEHKAPARAGGSPRHGRFRVEALRFRNLVINKGFMIFAVCNGGGMSYAKVVEAETFLRDYISPEYHRGDYLTRSWVGTWTSIFEEQI